LPSPTPTPTGDWPPDPSAPAPENWQPAFIRALALTGNVSEAARRAQIHRDTAYAHRKAEESLSEDERSFTKAWESALEIACDALEYEARRRAVEGVEEPVFHLGVVVGYIRRYSDSLLKTLLAAHRPEKYRETLTHKGEVTVKHGLDPTIEKIYGGNGDSSSDQSSQPGA
jgi:hypothetical protein